MIAITRPKPEVDEDRRALIERLREQREALLESVSEATKFLADIEKQIAQLEQE